MQKIIDLLWAAILTFWPIISLLVVVHISLSSPNNMKKNVKTNYYSEEISTRVIQHMPAIETSAKSDSENEELEIEEIVSEEHKKILEKEIRNKDKHVQKDNADRNKSVSGKDIQNSEYKKRKKSRRKTCRTNKNANMIQRIDSKTYFVSNQHFKYYMSHHKKALNLAELRIVASRTSDDFRGIRIKNISCDSPLYHMGFRRGDLVLSVSEMSLSSYKDMWKAYRHTKKSSSFSVKIRRGKEILTKNYTPTNM
jgi:hypothetical protein